MTKKKLFLIALAVIITVLSLLSLGIWQLQRLKYKNNLIEQIKHSVAAPALELEGLTSINLYTKIKLSGRFDNNKYIYLYGRRTAFPQKDGYYLLSPFITDNGDSVLVLRAWIPAAQKEQLGTFSSPSHEVITVIAMSGEKKQFFVPENDHNKNIWFTLDIEAAAMQLGTSYKNFYFMQLNADNLPPGAKALSANNLSNIRNDHLEYAITWFTLAFALLVIYIIFLLKNPRLK